MIEHFRRVSVRRRWTVAHNDQYALFPKLVNMFIVHLSFFKEVNIHRHIWVLEQLSGDVSPLLRRLLLICHPIIGVSEGGHRTLKPTLHWSRNARFTFDFNSSSLSTISSFYANRFLFLSSVPTRPVVVREGGKKEHHRPVHDDVAKSNRACSCIRLFNLHKRVGERERMYGSINHDLNQISTSARAFVDSMKK